MGGNDSTGGVLREVIESLQFQDQVKDLGVSVKRLDEVLFGVTWRIARTPDQCPLAIEGRSDLRITKTVKASSVPPLRILFAFDEGRVTLLQLSEVPADER